MKIPRSAWAAINFDIVSRGNASTVFCVGRAMFVMCPCYAAPGWRPTGMHSMFSVAQVSTLPHTEYTIPFRVKMVSRYAAALGVIACGYSLLLRLTPACGQATVVETPEACADFAVGDHPGSAWTLTDCIDVWTRFSRSVAPGLHRRLPYVDSWKEAAMEMRRVGSPCLVASNLITSDGVGSITIRHLATWIFAEEIGCDWVTPDWGKRHVNGGNGTVMYCHRTATTQEMDISKPLAELRAMRRCSVIDWLSFFQFGVPSVDLPEHEVLNIIQIGLSPTREAVVSTKLKLQNASSMGRPFDSFGRVVLAFHLSFASRHLLSLGSWDEVKRQTVRRILDQARRNFHMHPRPWYDENPECSYDKSRLNFAIHVRMGDRREFQDGNLEYFQLLEEFMDTVAQVVVDKALEPPLFHVFSETLVPCPSAGSGVFDEFPTWPVALDQIPACEAAEIPDDCPEKLAGTFCSPERSGVFGVLGKPIVLHVGPDVQNAMSCMIQADGVMMGCSTFGQIAGLLTKGISFFSMECGGDSTPNQYKSTPPLALAEMGYLWVPIAGSWRDPVLTSLPLLRGALDELLAIRGI